MIHPDIKQASEFVREERMKMHGGTFHEECSCQNTPPGWHPEEPHWHIIDNNYPDHPVARLTKDVKITRSMIHDLLEEGKEVECEVCYGGVHHVKSCNHCNGTGKVMERVRDASLFLNKLWIILGCGTEKYLLSVENGGDDDYTLSFIFATVAQLTEAMNRAYNPEWSE